MKLKGYLIITLTDFARYFDINDFWTNRYLFIRDMHPSKMYYWNNIMENAYHKVCEWLLLEDNNDETILEDALNNLSLMANTNIDIASFSAYLNQYKELDMTSEIIVINAPYTLSLPAYVEVTNEDKSIKLHKIHVKGDIGQKVTIKIGNNIVGMYECGEVIYVTECNGQFIELLPNHISNHLFEGRLIDNDGKFRSILLVKDKKNNEVVKIRDVVSFALIDDGYIYIDFQDSIVCNSTNVPLYMISDEENKVLALKYVDGVCYALYENGILKSTKSFNYRDTKYIN